MNFDLFSRSKYRGNDKSGDDVALVLPGVCFAVFDGATDAEGRNLNGVPYGRAASMAASQNLTEILLPYRNRDKDAETLFADLCTSFARAFEDYDLDQLPATTVAMAIDCGANWRFLSLGDSGIRINGGRVLKHEKLLDRISTEARVSIFKILAKKFDDPDENELMTRRAIFLGLAEAGSSGLLSKEAVEMLIEGTIDNLNLSEISEIVRDFLLLGIRLQNRFSNSNENSLCYDIVSSRKPVLGQWVEEIVPKQEVKTIEIFSDGYASYPKEVSIAAWEKEFSKCDEVDFHRIDEFPAVKGGTSTEFYDDRTLIVVNMANEANSKHVNPTL